MRSTTLAVFLALFLTAAPRAEAQASLASARDLYASAEYESALTMLDGLRAADHALDDRRSIELHRILCLVAIGRDATAKGAVDELVTRNPLYRPSEDVPPRVRAIFDEARRRLLPSAVQAKYQQAKAAFDFKDYPTAHRGFAEVLDVLADPDLAALAAQSPLSDLRMLAAGFEELSVKAIAPPVSPAVAEPPLPQPMAVGPAPRLPDVDRIYGPQDRNVVPPIVVNQRIPSFPGPIRSVHTGVIEVVIDDTGGVESAMMVEPVNPQFDRLTLAAAKGWQYQPAKVDGVPVKFLKRIQLSIVPKP